MSSSPDHETGFTAADTELLDRLSEVLEIIEPVPSHLKEVAYSAQLMANVDAELAELIFDSLTAPRPAMRQGDENQARVLSFSNADVTLDAALASDGSTIIGEIQPPIARELLFEARGEEPVTLTIDEFGRFHAASGAAAFRLRVPGYLVTPWIDRR